MKNYKMIVGLSLIILYIVCGAAHLLSLEIRYQNAIDALNKGEYLQAKIKFEKLNDHYYEDYNPDYDQLDGYTHDECYRDSKELNAYATARYIYQRSTDWDSLADTLIALEEIEDYSGYLNFEISQFELKVKKEEESFFESYQSDETDQKQSSKEDVHTYTPSSRNSSKVVESDPLDAKDYDDPEDFYEDNYDDFEDYEDAEDYYNEVHDD